MSCDAPVETDEVFESFRDLTLVFGVVGLYESSFVADEVYGISVAAYEGEWEGPLDVRCNVSIKLKFVDNGV